MSNVTSDIAAKGEHNDLTLTAGTGAVRLNENIGESQALGDFVITRADAGVFFGEADTETAGDGTTGPVTLIATAGITERARAPAASPNAWKKPNAAEA